MVDVTTSLCSCETRRVAWEFQAKMLLRRETLMDDIHHLTAPHALSLGGGKIFSSKFVARLSCVRSLLVRIDFRLSETVEEQERD